MCDKDDDVKIGVKSTAILFEKVFDKHDVLAIVGLQVVFFVIMVALISKFFGLLLACLLAIALSILFAFQYDKTKTRERLACFEAFKHNAWVGRVVLAVIVLACVLQYGMV